MERENKITFIVGRKGSGKSCLAASLVSEADKRIILDPMFEHKGGILVTDFDSLVEYTDRLRLHRYAVVFRSMEPIETDLLVALLTEGDPNMPPLPGVTIFIDEIDKLCDARVISEGLKRLVNYGRHYRVSLIAASRRPRQVHRDITANADRILIGQSQEPRDLEYLAEFVGETAAEEARTFSDFEFLDWPSGDVYKVSPDGTVKVISKQSRQQEVENGKGSGTTRNGNGGAGSGDMEGSGEHQALASGDAGSGGGGVDAGASGV